MVAMMGNISFDFQTPLTSATGPEFQVSKCYVTHFHSSYGNYTEPSQ